MKRALLNIVIVILAMFCIKGLRQTSHPLSVDSNNDINFISYITESNSDYCILPEPSPLGTIQVQFNKRRPDNTARFSYGLVKSRKVINTFIIYNNLENQISKTSFITHPSTYFISLRKILI